MNRIPLLLPFLLGLPGCTTFIPVRSGEVVAGPRLQLGATVSTPPGDDAAWFWGIDCVLECDHPIGGISVGAMYGTTPDDGPSFEIGAGLSGAYPYAEGFLQLSGAEHPFGIGARIGLASGGWREDAIYVAYDIRNGRGNRLFMTSALFRHGGGTPNAAIRGSFIAFVQGIGLENQRWGRAIVPSLALAVGRTRRGGLGAPTATGRGPYRQTHSSMTALLVVGVTATLGREPQ